MILIVDDDKTICMSLSLLVKRAGYESVTANNAEDALKIIRNTPLQLIVLDMNYSLDISGNDGLELLQKCKVLQPETPVILITAWANVPLAVEGIKSGAFDFMSKPIDSSSFLSKIETAITMSSKEPTVENTSVFDRSEIIGENSQLKSILATASKVANTDASVLILGENGTGKELIARAIHNASKRTSQPFVMVNLGGISQSLFESEMFGHVKGAFTGAVSDRKGRFEMADKGTIFLDEIGDLDLSCQVKLLRVLQQHTFEPLGDSQTRHVDFRLISATNANLSKMVANHTFREDLFYRINLITLNLPPLRERRDDIPLLVKHFVNIAAKANGISMPEVSSEAMTFLTKLPYTGNIRELKNIIDGAMLVFNGKSLESKDFERFIVNHSTKTIESTDNSKSAVTLDDMERNAILNAIEKYDGNMSKVAIALGITRQSLYRRLEKFDIKI
ncbi:MAG: sigma-54 dependent transcriptional regulator [Muribaculaceae bacterium]|nr:sigma-54 dependent transcriptional regulator [Muribaculaceae bacterium]MDE5857517.1 sigma-54 dependent transcriptional regulator [Muribaculaceae bacterium]